MVESLSDFILDADEILERKISKLGNSCHISVPSKHLGKICKVVIKNDIKTNKLKVKEV